MKKRNLLTSLFLTVFTGSLAFGQVIIQTPGTAPTPVIPGYPAGATIPYVISTVPTNADEKVNPTITQIKITFNQPMDIATFYWPLPLNSSDFPTVLGDPYWVNNNQTVILGVRLTPNTTYRIPINIGNQLIFRSAQGVPANPGYLSFRTDTAGASSISPAQAGRTPSNFRGTSNTPRPGAPVGAMGPRANVTPGVPEFSGIPQTTVNSANTGGNTGNNASGSTSINGGRVRTKPRTFRGTPTPTPSPSPSATKKSR